MKLAPSLHRIGSDLVNSYLVEDASGVTIIDAGLPGNYRDLRNELAAMGRAIGDVRGVILTHADTDHIGYAERLRREHGIPILVHELDAARARGEDKSNGKAGPMKFGPLLGFLWYGLRHGALRIPHIEEVVTFADGETLDLPGEPRVIHLPGHTAGSVAFHVAAVNALFVGDALTTRSVLTGAVGPQPAPFTLEPTKALTSLSHLDGVTATWVLPGHGPPWNRGVAEALHRVRQSPGPAGSHQEPVG
jgi:glyoxylase-like metal-dependent hydrolase (beta-lactamase superfamily II)